MPQKTKKIKVNGKEHTLKADRKLFGRLAVIALNMREVLTYPLGPLPWSLACTDGALAKTNKAKLAEVLERSTAPAVNDPECTAGIFDGMAVLKALKDISKSFAELYDRTLNNLLDVAKIAVRIDFVSDTYPVVSIKNAERCQ